jgi:hypothetical protein
MSFLAPSADYVGQMSGISADVGRAVAAQGPFIN